MSKDHSKKIMIDGITFHSKAKADRYLKLKMLEKTGKIIGLEVNWKFVIQQSFVKNGKHVKEIYYIADFVYRDARSLKIVVEDVKRGKTTEHQLKKRLFECKFPDLTITEIK